MIKKLLTIYRSNPIWRQLLLYALIGGTCAMIDFGIFSLCNHFLALDPLVANIIGCVIGMLCSFFLNYYINFKANSHFLRRLLSFLTVGSIGLLFSELIMHIGANMIEANEYLVKFLSVFLVAALQFLLNKFITFKGV
ncbi:MAG: GtrA family protein [Clostridia bacterium]|nr:GtrA family protein [Clostridia bacterium]